MRFTTGGGLKEAVIYESRSAFAQPLEYSGDELTFVLQNAKRGGRRGRQAPLLASLALSHSRGHQGPRSLLASLTGFSLIFQGRDAGLRKTFNSIDVDGKGHITEKDLETFARSHGLPGNYAAHFVSAVRATVPIAGPDGGAGGQQHPAMDAELTFAMFRRFVKSREEALKRAFSLFDQDGDGRISVDDLGASLARVAVCCPKTRCIYRRPSCMAKHLHSTAVPEHGFLGFSEFRDFFLLLPQQDMLVEYWVAAGAAPELSDKVSLGRTGDSAGAKGSPWGHLLAGAVAGATSRTATAPLETLRLAAMAGQLQSRSLAQAASDIVSSQGWRGLYRGNLLNVMRSAPQKALDFFVFDAFKRIIGDDSHAQTFLAAGLAGCTSWIALYPLEVVRSRITISSTWASVAAAGRPRGAGGPSLVEALTSIVRNEGPRSLYKGLGPSVAAIFPEAAITYGLHDALKKIYRRVAHEEPGVAPSLAFGVLSAFMGQLVSFPLETVSRRLQVAQGTGAAAAGGLAGAMAVAKGLLAEGGPAALYRGIGAATLRLVPMACVSFGTYEAVRALIVAWEQQRDDAQVKAMLHSRCVPLVLRGPNGDGEVVGRICTPPGGQQPTLCGAAASPCGGSGRGLEMSDIMAAAAPLDVATAAPLAAGAAAAPAPDVPLSAPSSPRVCDNMCGAAGAAASGGGAGRSCGPCSAGGSV